MSGTEKAEVLAKVASSGLPERETLGELGVPRSTYYRWLRRKEQRGLEDDTGGGNPPWNKLTTRKSAPFCRRPGDAGPELPTVGRMDYRQHGILGIRVYGLPHREVDHRRRAPLQRLSLAVPAGGPSSPLGRAWHATFRPYHKTASYAMACKALHTASCPATIG